MDVKFDYKNLEAYKEARNLVMMIYQLLKQFPKEETYALCDQLRRAVVSIPSNLAEGTSRYSTKEQLHFIEIAYGSLLEVECQIDIARGLQYITNEEAAEVSAQINKVAALIAVRICFIINLIIINKIIKKSRSLLRESNFFCNFAAEFKDTM